MADNWKTINGAHVNLSDPNNQIERSENNTTKKKKGKKIVDTNETTLPKDTETPKREDAVKDIMESFNAAGGKDNLTGIQWERLANTIQNIDKKDRKAILDNFFNTTKGHYGATVDKALAEIGKTGFDKGVKNTWGKDFGGNISEDDIWDLYENGKIDENQRERINSQRQKNNFNKGVANVWKQYNK